MNKIESSTEKWIEKDKRIWVTAKPNLANPSKDAFLQAKVIGISAKQISICLRSLDQEGISYDSKQYNVAYEDCQKLTYGPNDVSDMVDLQELNEPELLFNLKRRYLNDLIFTYCGPTLVIINPYAFIEKLFSDQLLLEYQAYVFLDTLEYKTIQPHVFGLAAFCLWQLFQNMRNQSIVISGESGAGKTENTKYCLKFLASLGKNMSSIVRDKSLSKIISTKTAKYIKKDSKLFGIEDKILGCNQILQAFGNAKTIRNDNSSRFGKLILLLYGQTQFDIKSAFIISYLLQKSRIVSVSQGERNYHIFYYIVKGTSPEVKETLRLNNKINEYKYLNQSTVYDIKGVSDQKKFAEVSNDFTNYFKKEEIDCIFKILSIVLNIGNLVFRKQFTKNNEQMAIPVNKQYIAAVVKLLQVNYEAFQFCFQYKTRKLGVSIINSPLRYDEAVALQDSFAKNLYERIFIFIVIKLNEKIELQKINLDETNKSFRKSIGLLDIFGFQVLGINSLEQFFINFANEKLQQLYVSYIFKEQQNQFLKEGLKQFSHDIGFQDNKPVIDLFQLYPLGLFHLINESSELNKPDEALPESIVKNHPKNVFVQIPKSKKGIFLINHSCSPVNYNTSGFTSRNKDQFPQQLLEVILKGTDQVLKTILQGDGKTVQTKNRTASKKFLGSKFLNEMNKLTQQLYSSDCHFVRCIKPNSFKSPKMFTSDAVLQSLRYLGVLDSILIRKLGYIYRRPFKEFIKKFYEIQDYIYNFAKFVEGKTEQDFKEHSKIFLLKHAPNEIGSRQILLGNKKILIKQSALNHLQVMAKQKRKMRIQCANKIKRMYVSSVFRGQTKKFLFSIKVLKSHLLFTIHKIRDKIMIKKCSKIQKYIKKYLLEKRLQKIKQKAEKSVSTINAYLKMKKQRYAFLQIKTKVITIQANIRFFLTMAQYLKEKNCREAALYIFEEGWKKIQNQKAVLIQKTWKGYVVRRKFTAIMEQIRKKLRLIKYRQFMTKIIFHHKFKRFQNILNKYQKPIILLQAAVRGKFARRTYIVMKRCAILIQRAFRRHLRKKYYLIKLWRQYRKNIYNDERQKVRELGKLNTFPIQVTGVKYYPETVGVRVQLFPQELIGKYGKGEQVRQNWQINETIQFNDKNTFQVYVGDYDIIGTQYYQGQWLHKYTAIKEEMKRKNEYPISVHFNNQFTTVISNKDKMYNFYSSQEEANKIQVNGAIQQISFGHSFGLMLKHDKKMYTWGYNYQNCIDSSSQLKVQLKEVPQLTKFQVCASFCKDSKRYFVDNNGKLAFYSYNQEKSQWKLKVMDFGFKACIKMVALSFHFTLFLTTSGQVYSQGSNKKGELGLGFASRKEVNEPQLIPYFTKNTKEIIETVSVGVGHCVAKSKLGNVFSWGNNNYSQVSNKNVQFVHTPQYLQSQEGKIKALQAIAGYRNTFILNQQLKTLGFGTSTSFPYQKGVYNIPIQMLKQTSSSKGLAEVKISVRWTRQLSILLINAIDLGRCKSGTKSDVLLKYLKMMAKEWIDDKVYPAYHQWADSTLQLSDIRKFKFGTPSNASKASTGKKAAKGQSDLDELKALMDLRKTSAIFKKAASQKVEELMQKLKSRPEAQWSDEQKELFEYIQDNLKFVK